MPEISSQLSNPSLDTYVKLWKIEEAADFFQKFPASWAMPSINVAHKSLESLAARYCLWELMKSLDLSTLVLHQDDRKRPYLNHSLWHVSISHSYPYAVACISKKSFTGIDLEKKDRNVQKIAPRFLSLMEFEHLKEDVLKLTLAWSAKESIYKAWKQPGLSFQKEIELQINADKLRAQVNQEDSFNVAYEIFDEFVITLVNH
jgi:4'-phosphopantetheinyl transferase EntD